ncbi:MAG TPA: hypothetical protein VGI25_06460 [Candidatus Udaeobacter sp.]|jgi:hypothetical protein
MIHLEEAILIILTSQLAGLFSPRLFGMNLYTLPADTAIVTEREKI